MTLCRLRHNPVVLVRRVLAHRAQCIADIQRGELAGQGRVADVEVDAQQLPLRAAVHHKLLPSLQGQEGSQLLQTKGHMGTSYEDDSATSSLKTGL